MRIAGYKNHLTSASSLVTAYERTRAGFIALALEKSRNAVPYVEEAKALKALASKVKTPSELLKVQTLRPSILTAAAISDKAANHLTEGDKTSAIKELIERFLKPAGKDFIDELVFRFLLTRGDSLGGRMRNLAGVLAEKKLSRAIIATLSITGKSFYWLHRRTREWVCGDKNEPDIESRFRGLHWRDEVNSRVLIYNLTVPIVRKNVDLCLFNARPEDFMLRRPRESCHFKPELYVALGELKGGIDPAGADEHWKTANSALRRIRDSFSQQDLTPNTFFIGAAIETSMAEEIYSQLERETLSNAANLTDDSQLISICNWLISL